MVRYAALATVAGRCGLMVYALGGVTAVTVKRLRHVPQKGTAAIQGMAAVR